MPEGFADRVFPERRILTCCVVFICDQNNLFPMLVSAMQARLQASPDKADVLICGLGFDQKTMRLSSDICDREGIKFITVDSKMIEGSTAKSSVLFMDRFLPEQYNQILYIDGDVQITRSLDPLIDMDVPSGRFMAVSDPMTFVSDEAGKSGRDCAQHMASIGLCHDDAALYFNSGVLRINRAGWNNIGLDAWKTTQYGRRTFRFPGQDPLNIVACGRHSPLSLAWNFPIFMRNALVDDRINPSITHFTSTPKPWHGAYAPWDAEACLPYAEILRCYPALAPYKQTLSLHRQVHYRIIQNYMKIIETVLWGLGERRARIVRYEQRVETLQCARSVTQTSKLLLD